MHHNITMYSCSNFAQALNASAQFLVYLFGLSWVSNLAFRQFFSKRGDLSNERHNQNMCSIRGCFLIQVFPCNDNKWIVHSVNKIWRWSHTGHIFGKKQEHFLKLNKFSNVRWCLLCHQPLHQKAECTDEAIQPLLCTFLLNTIM